ncbi:unnamed protein product [Phytophthora lilii]|uniref:Unnamed protein product n=1 Tax=Phytophthora lilii TaxID=2077276 RepID=A0A9W6X532_9STRA|nr:unnamed protein product [Phytophthora lilii]
MLSVRRSLRATSLLLRRPTRSRPSIVHRLGDFPLPSPTLIAPSSFALSPFQFYSQKSQKQEKYDLPTVLKTFEEFRQSGAANLSKNEASQLVVALVKHKRHAECVELLRSCQEQEVPLKPFARVSGLSTSCLLKEFEVALREFELLQEEQKTKAPWVYADALNAANKLNRQETVNHIFQLLVSDSGDKAKVEVNGDTVDEMFKSALEQGVTLSEFTLRTLIIYAEKSNQPDLALQVFSMISSKELDVYKSLIVVCSKNQMWSDAMSVFDDMPKALLPNLNGAALGYLIMAHTKSKSEELKLRGLYIFGEHEEKWNSMACAAALEALLETRQYDVLLALANDMRRRGMKWDSFVHKLMAQSHIRRGSLEKATDFLHANTRRLGSFATPCYRELIEQYANVRGDVEEACQLYLEMILNKLALTFSDWCNALELALQLSDHTVYWSIRKQFWMSGDGDLPPHLLLPGRKDIWYQEQDRAAEKADEYSDVGMALKVFRDIQKADGAGLTTYVGSRLLATVGKHDRADTCVEMLNYFDEREIFPKKYARVAAFKAMSNQGQYSQALQIFNTTLQPWMYSRALDTAIKMKRYSSVTEILHHLREHEVKLTSKDYTHIILCCTRVKEWALGLSILSSMKAEGVELTMPIFESLLSGCGNDNFWGMVIEVYNSMPNDLRLRLAGKSLGSVLFAHARSEKEEVQQCTARICNEHKDALKAQAKQFPYETAMVAMMEAKQFSDVIALANGTKDPALVWTPTMYRSIIMSCIHTGSMEQAKELLQKHTKFMNNTSLECYRELVKYSAEVQGSVLEAAKLSLQMVQNNTTGVTVDDWRSALQLALQLPDHTIYWELRRWLRLQEIPLSEFREHHLLPDPNHEQQKDIEDAK